MAPSLPSWHRSRVQAWPELLSSDDVKAIGSILMGAAHADGPRAIEEARSARGVLEELFGEKPLPDLVDHLLSFDPSTFDLASMCSALRLAGIEERRGLLPLIARVIDADSLYDLAEDSYLPRVAFAIGASNGEWQDLVVHYVE